MRGRAHVCGGCTNLLSLAQAVHHIRERVSDLCSALIVFSLNSELQLPTDRENTNGSEVGPQNRNVCVATQASSLRENQGEGDDYVQSLVHGNRGVWRLSWRIAKAHKDVAAKPSGRAAPPSLRDWGDTPLRPRTS